MYLPPSFSLVFSSSVLAHSVNSEDYSNVLICCTRRELLNLKRGTRTSFVAFIRSRHLIKFLKLRRLGKISSLGSTEFVTNEGFKIEVLTYVIKEYE